MQKAKEKHKIISLWCIDFLMDFSSDEELIVLATACYEMLKIKKKQINRNKRRTARFWVNPYLRERNTKGRFAKDVSV